MPGDPRSPRQTHVRPARESSTFWAELGYVCPPFPFIAHSRGWDAEDMQNNVRQVRGSEPLKTAAVELAERSLDYWKVLDHHRDELEKPMERAGRKAQPLGAPDEEEAFAV